MNEVEKTPNSHPPKLYLGPTINTWPSDDYDDDDETSKASVLQAGSLSSSIPPLSSIRHRPGDNKNVGDVGYLDHLVVLATIKMLLMTVDYLGLVVMVKCVREVMVVMILMMMVPFISGLDNDENDVDSHEEKDDCDFYE